MALAVALTKPSTKSSSTPRKHKKRRRRRRRRRKKSLKNNLSSRCMLDRAWLFRQVLFDGHIELCFPFPFFLVGSFLRDTDVLCSWDHHTMGNCCSESSVDTRKRGGSALGNRHSKVDVGSFRHFQHHFQISKSNSSRRGANANSNNKGSRLCGVRARVCVRFEICFFFVLVGGYRYTNDSLLWSAVCSPQFKVHTKVQTAECHLLDAHKRPQNCTFTIRTPHLHSIDADCTCKYL